MTNCYVDTISKIIIMLFTEKKIIWKKEKILVLPEFSSFLKMFSKAFFKKEVKSWDFTVKKYRQTTSCLTGVDEDNSAHNFVWSNRWSLASGAKNHRWNSERAE